MKTPLKFSFGLVNKISGTLQSVLKDFCFAEAFSAGKNELFINFMKNERQFGIRILWTAGNCFLFFQNKNFSRPVPHYKWFSELNERKIVSVIQHSFNRSFQVNFTDDFILVFKLYDHLSNIILFRNEKVIAHFRVNIRNDARLKINEFNNTESFSSNTKEKQLFETGADLFLSINEYNNDVLSEHEFENLKSKLIQQKSEELTKLNKSIHQSEIALKKISEEITNEQIADIIMSNLTAIKEGQERVTLHDFYRDKMIEIKLNREITPQQNAEHYYRKSKTQKQEVIRIQSRIHNAVEKSITIQAQLSEIHKSENSKQLKVFQKEKIKAEKEQSLFREFDFEGYKILVGKSAANNDLLTLKHSSKNDLWLHASGVSGSHVVIRNRQGILFSKKVIEFAASIAAYYSKSKGSSYVPVIYTEKKFVRKPKGAAPGAVIVEKEKMIMVEPKS